MQRPESVPKVWKHVSRVCLLDELLHQFRGIGVCYAEEPGNLLSSYREYKTMKTAIDDLQYQVQALFSQMGTVNSTDSGPVESSNLHSSPSLSAPQPGTPRYPRFHGPTSPVFSIGVAKHTLKNFGITGTEEDSTRAPNGPSPTGTPPPVRAMPSRGALLEARDPLYSIDKDEATRLVHFWRDNVMIMYPIVNIEQVLKHLSLLFSFLQAANRNGLFLLTTAPGAEAMTDDEAITLKLILANASTLERGGSSEIGLRFYANVAGHIEAITMKPPTMKSIEHLALAVRTQHRPRLQY
jgi:hypothetical protein